MPHIISSIDGAVATLALNNPPQNRLGPQMLVELEQALTSIEASGARALLIRGEGEHFSFGGDIEPWPSMDRHMLRSVFGRVMDAFRVERLPIPTVAAVRGGCFGGGLELALRADIVLAGETARFGHTEQELGIVTLLGGMYRNAERVGRAEAMAWALTSDDLSPQIMQTQGVVSRIVPDADLDREAAALVATIAAGATKAHAAHKALLRMWAAGGTAAADEMLLDVAIPLFETEDVKMALPIAADHLKSGQPRPTFSFEGR